jgi:hypothetical protein
MTLVYIALRPLLAARWKTHAFRIPRAQRTTQSHGIRPTHEKESLLEEVAAATDCAVAAEFADGECAVLLPRLSARPLR